MKLLAAALLAHMAVTEAKPLAGSPALSRRNDPRLLTDCKDIWMSHEKTGEGEFDNIYQVIGKCGGADPTMVDLSPCRLNDDGGLTWGKQGGFTGTCRDCSLTFYDIYKGMTPSRPTSLTLRCYCLKKNGDLGQEDLDYADLSEGNSYKEGKLTCNTS